MPFRPHLALGTLLALLAVLVVLAAPLSHDHLGKPGSVCHVCSTLQAVTLAAGLALAGATLRPRRAQAVPEPAGPISRVVSRQIPRAPPA